MPQTFDNVGHCVFSIFCFAVRIQLAFSPAEARVVRAPVQVIKWKRFRGDIFPTRLWCTSSATRPFCVAQLIAQFAIFCGSRSLGRWILKAICIEKKIYINASRLQVVVLKRVKPYQRSLLKAIFEIWTIKMSVCQVELPRFTKTLRSPMRTIVVLIDQRHLTLTRHPMTILSRSLLYERYVVPAFCFIKTAHLFCSAGCCTWLEVINTAPERGKNIFSNS